MKNWCFKQVLIFCLNNLIFFLLDWFLFYCHGSRKIYFMHWNRKFQKEYELKMSYPAYRINIKKQQISQLCRGNSLRVLTGRIPSSKYPESQSHISLCLQCWYSKINISLLPWKPFFPSLCNAHYFWITVGSNFGFGFLFFFKKWNNF